MEGLKAKQVTPDIPEVRGRMTTDRPLYEGRGDAVENQTSV
jgi:hypothetical protein